MTNLDNKRAADPRRPQSPPEALLEKGHRRLRANLVELCFRLCYEGSRSVEASGQKWAGVGSQRGQVVERNGRELCLACPNVTVTCHALLEQKELDVLTGYRLSSHDFCRHF